MVGGSSLSVTPKPDRGLLAYGSGFGTQIGRAYDQDMFKRHNDYRIIIDEIGKRRSKEEEKQLYSYLPSQRNG